MNAGSWAPHRPGDRKGPSRCTPRANTVQLGELDGVVRRVVWRGPGRVVGAFDVPLGHLAFDDSGGCACASGGVEPTEEAAQEPEPAGVVGVVPVRGERRPGGRWSGG